MELRATFQIPTLIKALTDIVLPAVDPNNKLAQEQAQLIIGSLHLMAQRLPLQVRYDRRDIQSFIELSEQLREKAGSAPELATVGAALATITASTRNLLQQPGIEPGDLESANLALRSAVGRFVEAASALNTDSIRAAIEAAVMSHAQELLLRERAWLVAQGWEGKEPNLPAIESLIGNG